MDTLEVFFITVKISASGTFNTLFKMSLWFSRKRDVCKLMAGCDTSKFRDLPEIESEQYS